MINAEQGIRDRRTVLFKPASWLSKIDFINHLVLFNNVLITVLAEHKGGKSSFVSLLEKGLDEQIKTAQFRANAMMTSDHILEQTVQVFHFNPQEAEDMSAVVRQANERKSPCLLIIDDAHYLPEAWLIQALEALQTQGSHGCFHVCLISDFSLVPHLNRLAANRFQHLIHTIELTGLNDSETRIYLTQKLQDQGVPPALINDALLQKIFKVTAGDLSRLNNNLHNYAKEALHQTPPRTYPSLKKTAAAFSVLVALSGLSYFYLSGDAERFIQAIQPAKRVVHNEIMAKPIEDLASEVPFYQTEAKYQLVEPTLPLNDRVVALLEDDENEPIDPDFVLMDKVVVIPAIQSAQTVVAEQLFASEIPKIPGFPSAQSAVAKAEPNMAPRVTMNKNGTFTVQILASNQPDYLLSFSKKYKLDDSFRTYKIQNKDKVWYVLTFGRYVSYAEARQGMKNLPVAIGKMGPWVRSTAALQELG